MFTGIIEQTGDVRSFTRGAGAARLIVGAPGVAQRLHKGDSVAVSGVCLTALEMGPDWFAADLAAETIARTTLSRLHPGSTVNLELPTPAGAPLGGHVVQGHVDGTGTVAEARDEGFARLVTIAAPGELLRYVVEKGSIAVDGVSLTVADVDGESFTVSLIPETLERTTLGDLVEGNEVNVEVDVVARYAERLLQGLNKK